MPGIQEEKTDWQSFTLTNIHPTKKMKHTKLTMILEIRNTFVHFVTKTCKTHYNVCVVTGKFITKHANNSMKMIMTLLSMLFPDVL